MHGKWGISKVKTQEDSWGEQEENTVPSAVNIMLHTFSSCTRVRWGHTDISTLLCAEQKITYFNFGIIKVRGNKSCWSCYWVFPSRRLMYFYIQMAILIFEGWHTDYRLFRGTCILTFNKPVTYFTSCMLKKITWFLCRNHGNCLLWWYTLTNISIKRNNDAFPSLL